MAALDCFLDLEPMTCFSPAAEAAAVQPGAQGPTGACGAAMRPCWVAVKRQQQLKVFQQQQQPEEAAYPPSDDEDDVSRCTSSPGCSYTASAAMGASLLDLTDDACSAPSAPTAAAAAMPAATAAAGAQLGLLLPGGTSTAAATFWDDLAAKGSVYQYCLQL